MSCQEPVLICRRNPVLTVGALALGLGCSGGTGVGVSQPAAPGASYVPVDVEGSYDTIYGSADVASDLEALIGPYRTQMEAELSEVLADAKGAFVKADPEGALG